MTNFAEVIDKQMRLVEAVRDKVFPDIPKDHVKALKTPDYDCIEFGEYTFYPVEDTTPTIAGPRTVIAWDMSEWVTVHNYSHEPDDCDEREIGRFPNIAACLAEVGRLRYADKIDAVGEALFCEDMEKAEKEYNEMMDQRKYEPTTCPHGREFHECNACMIASDLAYDAAREARRHFGR